MRAWGHERRRDLAYSGSSAGSSCTRDLVDGRQRHGDVDRDMEASTGSSLGTLPCDIMANLLTYAGAESLLRYEVTSRAAREVIRSREASLWSVLLRATWPREGDALVSLAKGFLLSEGIEGVLTFPRMFVGGAVGDERRIFRALMTSRDASTNIARLDANGVHDERRGFRASVARRKAQGLYDGPKRYTDRLAFIVTMGEFCGLASWQTVHDERLGGGFRLGLRWQPRVDETHFDFDCSMDACHQWDEVMTREKVGAPLRQSLSVIDMHSFECVQLLKDDVPWSLELLDADYKDMKSGDVIIYPDRICDLFRHNHGRRYCGDDTEGMYYTLIKTDHVEVCKLAPYATLRPCGSDGVFQLRHVDLSYDQLDCYNVTSIHHFCDLVADVIKQTHAPVTSSPGDGYNSNRTESDTDDY